MNLTEQIKLRAFELGFDLVGIAPAGAAPHAAAYADWIASGFAGEMAYMTRDPDRRSDLRRVLPNAQSIIVAGLNYYTIDLPDDATVPCDPLTAMQPRSCSPSWVIESTTRKTTEGRMGRQVLTMVMMSIMPQ